jgi:arylsulfatase A-like enzyme
MNASDSIKAYMAANIEFDKSMELLLQKLEEDGKINDTVIVIAADHYPYGLTYEEIKAYDPTVQNKTFDLYKNKLIIYNPELKETHITKNIYSIDVLPTILNMFGISYDSRLLIGKELEVLLANVTDDCKYYVGRSYREVPEDTDGVIYVENTQEMIIGDFIKVKIIDALEYDLIAEIT